MRWAEPIRRHPLAAFYMLAFAISWAGVIAVARQTGMPAAPEQMSRALPLAIALMLLGPSIAGVLVTWRAHGTAGLRELRGRLLHWQVAPYWTALALLTAPVLMLAVLLVFSAFAPQYLPGILNAHDRWGLLRLGLLAGLSAGIFEELGWTGLALPMFRQRFNVLGTGLLMGILWGAWHYPVNFLGSGDAQGHFDLPVLASSLFWSLAILPLYRVLMVWVYAHTQSLPLAMLMHASLTGSMVLLNPVDSSFHIFSDVGFALLLLLTVTLALRAERDSQRSSSARPRVSSLTGPARA